MQKSAEEEFYDFLMGKTAELSKEKDQPLVVPPPVPEPEVTRKISPRSVFSNPETHPYVLDLAMLKHFHIDWMTWLPETLFKEIELTFQTSVAEVNKLKILAAQTLHVTDMYWEEWALFEKTLWALNGQVPRLDSLQPPDLSVL